MAFIQPQEEEKNAGQTLGANPQIGNAAGLPTTGGGSTGGGGTGPSSPGTPDSQHFAGLNQYLDANKDQAGGVATTIAGNLNTEFGNEKGSIDQASQDALGASKSGSATFDPNLLNSAVSDPSKFVQDPNNVSQFGAMRDATYKGPESFQSSNFYGKAADAGNKAQQNYQLGQSGGGFGQLLNGLETNPTQGKNALDTALLQTDPTAGSTVKAATDQFKGIGDYLGGKANEVNTGIAANKQATTDASSQTKAGIGKAATDFGTSLQDQFKGAQDNYSKIAQQYQNAQKGINPSDLSQYGYSQADINGLVPQLTQVNEDAKLLGGSYNPNFSSFLKFDGSAPTQSGVATSDQAAKSAALAKLQGQGGVDPLGGASDVGSYKAPSIGFDKAGQQADLNSAKQNYSDDKAYAAVSGDLQSQTLIHNLSTNPAYLQNVLSGMAASMSGISPEKAAQIANLLIRMGKAQLPSTSGSTAPGVVGPSDPGTGTGGGFVRAL